MCNFLLAIVLSACSAWANAGDDWKWAKATNVTSKWAVEEGRAEVSTQGGTFKAILFSGKPDFARFTLSGKIQGAVILVTETVHYSDFSGSQFQGKLPKQHWKQKFHGQPGMEAITLSDGWSMIVLARTVDR
jgi:hypothetical protein